MALVDYSDSESSGAEDEPVAKQSAKPKAAPTKPAFQKVVDRSDSHKIRINLPNPAKPNINGEESERPLKRAKLGSGGIGGFNALLPAPKRTAIPTGGLSFGGSRKGGLGAGVNLKTGATPGFSREAGPGIAPVEQGHDDGSGLLSGAEAQEISATASDGANAVAINGNTVEQSIPKARSTMFKPLSVARKPQKKKIQPTGGTTPSDSGTTQQPNLTPNVPLFSVGDVKYTSREEPIRKGAYQPMIYHTNAPHPTPSLPEASSEANPEPNIAMFSNASTSDPPPQTLDSIASDLNLSSSAKRQLLGRQKHNASAMNIVNFNTDEEYNANEDIRKSGEQVQHNAVRAIAPGKHSLKQLVNMGTMQAEALEESFASGRRNRSEAGSKYGW